MTVSRNLALKHLQLNSVNPHIVVNEQFIDGLDKSFNSELLWNITGNVHPTIAELSSAEVHRFIGGSVSSNFTFNIPASLKRPLLIINETSFSATIVSVAAGNSVIIPPLALALVVSDGTDILLMSDLVGTLNSTVLDTIGSTRGSILHRGASSWQTLAPGVVSYLLSTQGSGADVSYIDPNTATYRKQPAFPQFDGSAVIQGRDTFAAATKGIVIKPSSNFGIRYLSVCLGNTLVIGDTIQMGVFSVNISSSFQVLSELARSPTHTVSVTPATHFSGSSLFFDLGSVADLVSGSHYLLCAMLTSGLDSSAIPVIFSSVPGSSREPGYHSPAFLFGTSIYYAKKNLQVGDNFTSSSTGQLMIGF